ncbi:MAG: signal peptidase II [Clostridiales bacterium]|nr:signal peptidase II [Clostridiales bacterium]
MSKVKNFFKSIKNFFVKCTQAVKNFLYKNRFGTVMVLMGITIVFWDLILKFLTDGENMDVIKGFFRIESLPNGNTGGAFGILGNNTTLLIVLSIVFIAALVVFNIFLKYKNYFYAISMGLIFSGALCNLYDRIKFGRVRDFIKLEFINFPTFNIADIAICVGVIMLAIYLIFIMPKLEKKAKLALEINTEQAKETNVQTAENKTDVEVAENVDTISTNNAEVLNNQNGEVEEDITQESDRIDTQDVESNTQQPAEPKQKTNRHAITQQKNRQVIQNQKQTQQKKQTQKHKV